MALLKGAALGAIAAISVPYVLRDSAGMLSEMISYGTVHPEAGTFGFPFSIPIFLFVTAMATLLFRVTTD